MSQKIAIAVIHGAGSQGPDFAKIIINKIIQKFQELLPPNDTAVTDKLLFKSVYWANILAKKQRILWNSVMDDDGNLGFEEIRKFILNFGADAVAYQPGAHRREIYNLVHQTMAHALHDLAEACGAQAPLCIIGHSIGTVVTHNYLFDLRDEKIADTKFWHSITPLEAGKTLTLLYMLGSPLALWSLRYKNYQAIDFPGSDVASLYPQLKPKWLNYYDTDDILAYPIRSLSSSHQDLAEQGFLIDIPVNVGGIFSSWNPLSHLEYWTSDEIVQAIAQDLFEMWQAIN